jgi:hypothetical protein
MKGRWLRMTRRRKVVVAALVGVLIGFTVACVRFTRYVRFVRRDVRQTLCVHNLKMLALQLKMYAEEHDGAFPDKWSTLVSDTDLFPPDMLEIFVCPAGSREYEKEHGVPLTVSGPEDVDERSTYVLVSGLRPTDDKDTVLAYEKGDNHGGIGHSVLYLDGRGGWDPPSNWR